MAFFAGAKIAERNFEFENEVGALAFGCLELTAYAQAGCFWVKPVLTHAIWLLYVHGSIALREFARSATFDIKRDIEMLAVIFDPTHDRCLLFSKDVLDDVAAEGEA